MYYIYGVFAVVFILILIVGLRVSKKKKTEDEDIFDFKQSAESACKCEETRADNLVSDVQIALATDPIPALAPKVKKVKKAAKKVLDVDIIKVKKTRKPKKEKVVE